MEGCEVRYAQGDTSNETPNEFIATQFTTIDAFYSAITSKAGASLFCFWNTVSGDNIYVDYIRFAKLDLSMDFEDETDVAYLRSGTDAVWKESSTCDKGYTENGIISYYHGTTAYAGVKFQYNDNGTGVKVTDWDKIEIRIRIIRGSDSSSPGTDGGFGTFYMGNTSISIGRIDNCWSTLTIEKADITGSDAFRNSIDSFWTAFTSESGVRFFWCYDVWGVPDWTIQISSISLVKNA